MCMSISLCSNGVIALRCIRAQLPFVADYHDEWTIRRLVPRPLCDDRVPNFCGSWSTRLDTYLVALVLSAVDVP